jgi:3-deoxy-D-arabino-heptulosonate 7-phosphate (DAHP) synthase class II
MRSGLLFSGERRMVAAGYAVAFEVGDAAEQFAAVHEDQITQVLLLLHFAEVLFEHAGRMLGVGDLQRHAQVAERLALECKPALARP